MESIPINLKLTVLVSFFILFFAFQSHGFAENQVSESIVQEANSHLNTPYTYGGESPEGFDSSGFVFYVMKEGASIFVPRTTSQQFNVGTKVERSDLQPGDVVFFSTNDNEEVSHNGIYLGDNQYIHVTTSEGVKIDSFSDSSYWESQYTEARRFNELKPSPTHPVAKEAVSLIGSPYKSGGETPEGFNTTGFVEYAFESGDDITLPDGRDDQWAMGENVSRENLKPGDVVFFSNTYKEGISHNGIYIGNDQFVHVTTSVGVTIDFLTNDSYYNAKYTGAKRYNSVQPNPEHPVAKEAMNLIGSPYKRGGESPNGFNTTGFVEYAFESGAGIIIPDGRMDQWSVGEEVAKENLQPGDVLFFSNTYKKGISHNGIYIGNDQFVHVTTTDGVKISYLDKNSYYSSRYTGAKRYDGLTPSPTEPVAKEAMNLIGSPYERGGESPNGFNTTGFVEYAFESGAGIIIPDRRMDQWSVGEEVAKEDLQPGDVLFFSNTYKSGISHNGIYVGNDQFVHVTTSSGVKLSYLDKNSYYSSRYTGAKRYAGLTPSPTDPVAKEAMNLIGSPYKSGGESPEGFNTTGFVEYAFESGAQIVIPDARDDQWAAGEEVAKEDLQVGDVVFFSDTYKPGISHNGIYVGNDQFVHVTTSSGVKLSYLDKNSYYSSKYTGARRYRGIESALVANNPIASKAVELIGTPYKKGGESPDGFNTTGFVTYVFNSAANIVLPGSRDDQWGTGEEIAKADLQAGDVVFFSDTYKPGISHNGIYIGDDKFVHVTTSSGVSVNYLNKNSYYSSKYTGAKRYNHLKPKATNDITEEALSHLDAPYESGGESPTGFNSSGYIQYVYQTVLNTIIPRTTDNQWKTGEAVAEGDLQPGDVVFFSNTYKAGLSHNGIYLGDDQFIHVTSSDGVVIDYIKKSSYYSDKYTGARRFQGLKVNPANPIPALALELVGTPYEEGGRTASGFNSSGYIHYVFEEAATIHIPNYTDEQAEVGETITKENLQPGDVVFFENTYKEGISHNGIYLGNDKFSHVTTSEGVVIDYLNKSNYYSSKFAYGKRYDDLKLQTDLPVVAAAASYLGVPYELGTERMPDFFDCSSFVQHIYNEVFGVFLPRTSQDQWEFGEPVDKADLQPGDVVFFSNTYKPGISHNGIYVGNGQIIHANGQDDEVSVGYLNQNSYYSPKYTGARRYNTDSREQTSRKSILEEAKKHLGVPYVKDGTSPDGFNASGFVQYVFQQHDIVLPNYGSQQIEVGTPVTKEDLKPGDLVFFEGEFIHPGIYIGNHEFIHTSSSYGVHITHIEESNYWGPKYKAARRIIQD